MKTQQSRFKLEAEKIRVLPPNSAWKRIEAQLDADGSRRKIKTARIINYAAAIILIAVFSTIGLYYYATSTWNNSIRFSNSLESLSSYPVAEASIYDIDRVKDLTAYFAVK